MSNVIALNLAKDIEADIRGRKGFRDMFEQLPEEILREIRTEWRKLISRRLGFYQCQKVKTPEIIWSEDQKPLLVHGWHTCVLMGQYPDKTHSVVRIQAESPEEAQRLAGLIHELLST